MWHFNTAKLVAPDKLRYRYSPSGRFNFSGFRVRSGPERKTRVGGLTSQMNTRTGFYDGSIGRVAGCLLIHIVQYPDAAGNLLHCQHESVLGKGHVHSGQDIGNHQSEAVKSGDAKGVPHHNSSR